MAPHLLFTYPSILKANVCCYASPSRAGASPSSIPCICSTQHCAQGTCVEGGGSENPGAWKCAFSIAGGAMGPGDSSPTWLFAGIQLRTNAQVLWNLDVTNLKIVNDTINHLFNDKSRKVILHPTPNFFHFQIMCLKPWEVGGSNSILILFNYLSTLTLAFPQLIKATMGWLSLTKGFRSHTEGFERNNTF